MSDITAIAHAPAVPVWLTGYSDGKVIASPDGITPGAPVVALPGAINAIGFDGVGRFVAVGASGNLATSDDNGATWTAHTSGFGSSDILDVNFAGGWIAVGKGGKMRRSADGVAWATVTTTFGTSDIHCILFAAGIWIAGGAAGKGSTSPDGNTWTAITSTGFGGDDIFDVAQGSGLFVFVGTSGKGYTSSDAVTWTSRSVHFGSAAIRAISFMLGLFTMVGDGGLISTSPDGLTWTARSSGTSSNLYAVVNYLFSVAPFFGSSPIIPMIQSVSFTPTKIDPTKSLGVRSSASITLKDFPWADRDTDKYFRERAYNAFDIGTYFGKWLARNPYYQNRKMNVYTGYVDDSGTFIRENFIKRTYLLDQVTGPTSGYTVTITAKDPLKLVDNTRAQAPVPTTGTVLADFLSTDPTFTLTPAGVGDLQYDAAGTVAVSGEAIRYTRVGDVVTVVARGSDGTAAANHSAGDAVQLCLRYSNATITAIVYDLLTNPDFGNIDPAFINLTQWNAEAATWLGTMRLSTLIPKPTGVQTLLNELTQQCLFYIWWDDRNQTIPFRAVRPPTFGEAVPLSDANNIIAGTPTLTEQPADRVSEVFVFYGQINALLDLTRVDNYQFQELTIDAAAESADEYGEARYSKIFSRWFKAGNKTEASTLGIRILKKYRDNPKTLVFRLDGKDSAVWTGGYVTVTTRAFQDETGASAPQNLEIVQANEVVAGSVFEYQALNSFFNGRYCYIMEDGTPVYGSASQHQKDTGGFICQDSGTMINGDPGYLIP